MLKELENGIFFSNLVDEKFKLNTIVVNFVVELNEKFAALNTIFSSLMRQSCAKYSNNIKMGRQLRKLYGADLFSDVKKAGNFQIISFGISFLDDFFALDGEKTSKQAIELLGEVIFNPNLIDGEFSKKDFETERQDIIDIVKSIYANKQQFAKKQAIKELFKGKNLAIDKYGSIKALQDANHKELKKAHEDLLLSSKISISYVGRSLYEEELQQFFSRFFKLNRKNFSAIKKEEFLANNLKQKEEEDFLTQSKLVLGFGLKEKLKKSKKEEVTFKVMNALFGATATSLLFTNVREKLSLCYYCRSIYDEFSEVILVESGVETKNVEKAKQAIKNQLDIIKNGQFSSQELVKAKYALQSVLKMVLDGQEKISNYFLYNFLKEEETSIEEKIKLIDSVEKDDVVFAARRFFLAIEYVLKGGKTKNAEKADWN